MTAESAWSAANGVWPPCPGNVRPGLNRIVYRSECIDLQSDDVRRGQVASALTFARCPKRRIVQCGRLVDYYHLVARCKQIVIGLACRQTYLAAIISGIEDRCIGQKRGILAA